MVKIIKAAFECLEVNSSTKCFICIMSLNLTNEKAESLERLMDFNLNLSEPKAFTLTISRYIPEKVGGSDLCALCHGRPRPVLTEGAEVPPQHTTEHV